MVKRIVLAAFLVVATVTFTSCGPSINTTSSAHSTVVMSASQFTSYTNWTIKAGQSVLFSDPVDSGGVHVLLTGKDGNYIAEAGAPDDFNNATGITFNPGDSKLVTFANSGTYTVTCTIHDAMIVTIAVLP